MEKNQNTPEYLFDFKEMDFVVERILEKYLLRGKLKEYKNSFLVVCDKDMKGNELSYNLSLKKIGRLFQSQRKNITGLDFNFFANPLSNPLQKSQWFSRFNYYEPATIVSEGKIMYNLVMPHQEKMFGRHGVLIHRPNMDEIFNAGPFQWEKLRQDRVLVCDVNSKRLDEIIRDIYKDRLREGYL
ncbi:MAG: hypothetical protein ABIF18_02810 [archaeon]